MQTGPPWYTCSPAAFALQALARPHATLLLFSWCKHHGLQSPFLAQQCFVTLHLALQPGSHQGPYVNRRSLDPWPKSLCDSHHNPVALQPSSQRRAPSRCVCELQGLTTGPPPTTSPRLRAAPRLVRRAHESAALSQPPGPGPQMGLPPQLSGSSSRGRPRRRPCRSVLRLG